MFFKENPFYLLGVHSTDGKRAIEQAAEEKAALAEGVEAKAYRDAAEILLHPEWRCQSEFFWLCGTDKETAVSLVRQTVEGEDVSLGERQSLSVFNRFILALNHLYYGKGEDAFSDMEELLSCYPLLKAEAVRSLISQDRDEAGFPGMEDVSALESWLHEAVWQAGVAVDACDGSLSEGEYGRLLARLEEMHGTDGILMARLLSAYEEKHGAEIKKIREELEYAVQLSFQHAPQGKDLFSDKVKAYGEAIRPFLISAAHGNYCPLFVEEGCKKLLNGIIRLYQAGKKKEALSLLELFLKETETGGSFLSDAKRWKRCMEAGDVIEGQELYEVSESARGMNVPDSVCRISCGETVRQEGKKGTFLLLLAVGIIAVFLWLVR